MLAMPDTISSAQSFGHDYMRVADGFLFSEALQISEKKKKREVLLLSFHFSY